MARTRVWSSVGMRPRRTGTNKRNARGGGGVAAGPPVEPPTYQAPKVRAAILRAVRPPGLRRWRGEGGRRGRAAVHRPSIGAKWTTLPPLGTPTPLMAVEISGGLVGRGLGRRGEPAPAPAVADPAKDRPQPEHASLPLKRVCGSAARV